MNWIKSVRLENFQSHLDTYIVFDKGLNVIVGPSDSGKTAIFRGIRWALYNEPRGSDFLRVGADFVRVTVEFANGTIIIRERTPSKNRYILKEKGKEDMIFEGFGSRVPKEIEEAHRMIPLRIERDFSLSLHMAEQLDRPFLLSESPAVRAKTIGRISGAHFLDMAIRDTAKDVQKLKQQISYTEQEKEKLVEQIGSFSFLDRAKNELDRANERFLKLHKLVKKKEKLEEIKERYEQLCAQYEKWQSIYELVKDVHEWEAKRLFMEKAYERIVFYERRLQEWEELNKNIRTCRLWLEKTKHCFQAEEKLCLIENSYKKQNALRGLQQQFAHVNDSLLKTKALIEKTAFATNERLEYVKHLENMNERVKSLKKKKLELDEWQKQRKQVEKFLAHLRPMKQVHELSEAVETALQKYQQLSEIKRALMELTEKINIGHQFLNEKKKEEESLKQRYEKTILNLGTCPTCGGKIDKQRLASFLQ